MANKITTLKLEQETKQRLEKLREHKRETYDEIIRKIIVTGRGLMVNE